MGEGFGKGESCIVKSVARGERVVPRGVPGKFGEDAD